MISKTAYETVIGLEAHVQLNTRSKAFCGDRNEFGGSPNTHISTVSLGYPGTLPRLNETQLKHAIKLGLALDCEINRNSTFDRKNYFYADLPKGYQITQDKAPICLGGQLPVRLSDGRTKNIRIHHIHMEEDAGKSIHPPHDKAHSHVDLNRAGTPLLEIVTEPDLRSAEEVEAFMNGLRQLVRYLGISDGNMQEGSLRCDVNISVRPLGSETFGTRCEVKNMNSMKFARKAVEFEVERQIELIESGGQVKQQTLQFDPVKGTTSPLRDKEDAHDYRYFPEPDLPPIKLTMTDVEAVLAEVGQCPWQAYEELKIQYALSDYDAKLISNDRLEYELYKTHAEATDDKQGLAKLFLNKLLPYLAENNINPEALEFSPKQSSGLLDLIKAGKVSSAVANSKLFPYLIEHPEAIAEAAAEQLGLIQNTDTDYLTGLVEKVLADNPDKVKAYQKGKKGLIGFFMGEVMKQSQGKAEPKETQALLRKALES